jgi:hypothetical protein
MTAEARMVLLLTLLIGVSPLLTGCGLAGTLDKQTGPSGGLPAAGNPGEQQGTVPAGESEERAPRSPAGSPGAALERFASLYINWTYSTLAAQERRLAQIAVGEARLAERQAAATAGRDTALRNGRIYNRGTVVAVGPLLGGGPGRYVVVTREETGGDEEYAGLQAAFHVTLATVGAVAGGWVVSEWQPQS